MSTRKVFFPFKLKVMLMLVLILGLAISLYVWFAIDIFKKDKSAYIYENSLTFTENLASQISLYLKDVGNRSNLLIAAYVKTDQSNTLETLIQKNDDFIDLQIVKNQKTVFSVCNREQRENEIVCQTDLGEMIKEIFHSKEQVFIKNVGQLGSKMHFIFALKEKDEAFVVRVNTIYLDRILDQNALFQSRILNQGATIFYGLDDGSLRDNSSYQKQVISFITSKVDKGTFKGIVGNKTILSSYSKVPGFNKYILSEIEEAKAFSAAHYLIKKSLYFALLVLSLSLLIGVIFSRNVTRNVHELYLATKRIAQRDFKSKVHISSRDEVGVLADSFNMMSDEILMYMEEMKEKARLENEMKVASLVQTAFFPKSEIESEHLSIAAFYTPATECGGDWWGHIERPGKHVLILADATGHGVPAALLTATINASASMIEKFSNSDPSILDRPDQLLELMNHSVCSVGANIMLTCFVGVIDIFSKRLTYANASHNPPLLLKDKGAFSTLSKDDFVPLMGSIGPRLGQDQYARFSNETVALDNNDLLILYTDGLLECTNNEKKAWGKRKFLQSILKNHSETVAKIRDNVVGELNDFKQNNPNDDDITLIVTRLLI